MIDIYRFLSPLTALPPCPNDLTIGWQSLNLLSHPNAMLAPQAMQARASGENLNYMTLAPQARQARPSGEILNYLLSCYSDILVRSLTPPHQRHQTNETFITDNSTDTLITMINGLHHTPPHN